MKSDGAETADRPRIALVMSGGGARGAYEAGVLSYLLDDLPKRLGRPAHFDIATGSSVGACYAERLIALGRSDAVQAEDELVAFFRRGRRSRACIVEGAYDRG